MSTPYIMIDFDRFRQRVLDDQTQKTAEMIAQPEREYALGVLHGRLLACAMSEVITKSEFDLFHDRLEAHGLSSRLKLPHTLLALTLS